MTKLSAAHLRTVVEATAIATSAGSMVERAEELLDVLGRIVPFDSARVALLEPERQGHDTLAQRGYDCSVLAYLEGAQLFREIQLVGLRRLQRAPMRAQEALRVIERSAVWEECLWPAGIRDIVSLGLFHPDGRYLGVLAMHSGSSFPLTDEALAVLGMLTPAIVTAVDPLRSLARVASIVGDAVAGVVLTREGKLLPLPGLPPHGLLGRGSALLSVVGRQSRDEPYMSFLCPDPLPDDANRHLRVTVLACPPDLPDYLAGVVLLSPAGDLHGLTRRELEVLGLLVEGFANAQIAATLVVSQRTVATHLEHILAKLEVSTRGAAAVHAFRLGLYVPRSLVAPESAATDRARTAPRPAARFRPSGNGGMS